MRFSKNAYRLVTRSLIACVGLLSYQSTVSFAASTGGQSNLLSRARQVFLPIPETPPILPGNASTPEKIKLGLMEGQEVVGAKRGGKCIGIYIDDERQSSRPPGPRPAGLAANAPSAASPRFKGSTDPVFTAASCIWSVCRQSTLICRRDRALVHRFIKTFTH